MKTLANSHLKLDQVISGVGGLGESVCENSPMTFKSDQGYWYWQAQWRSIILQFKWSDLKYWCEKACINTFVQKHVTVLP